MREWNGGCGEWEVGVGDDDMLVKGYKVPLYNINTSGNLMYNMVTTGKNCIVDFKFAKRVNLVFSPHTQKGNSSYTRS